MGCYSMGWTIVPRNILGYCEDWNIPGYCEDWNAPEYGVGHSIGVAQCQRNILGYCVIQNAPEYEVAHSMGVNSLVY